MSNVAAIILAAGKASRFRAAAGEGGPATKLVAQMEGRPLIAHAAAAALASKARPILVVTGHADTEVRESLSGMPLTFAHNPDFAQGMSTSLQTGIAALPETVSGALVLLGDMPRVSAGLLDLLIATFNAHPQARAVVPVIEGRRGNPVLIARDLFPAVASISGDVGARPVLQAAGKRVVEVVVQDAGAAFDVDSPDALAD
jgi:molybdenum cofactor cytidylyltransferase